MKLEQIIDFPQKFSHPHLLTFRQALETLESVYDSVMDYSFYDPRSQPSGFSLYGLPTPDQPHAQPDTFAPVVGSLFPPNRQELVANRPE